ncbi:MAG TPA: hypothetical protein VMV10_18160, partial [Pirellulales bacterium]|nr:hypothetical protein [Pirellulales bacterium]
MPLALPGEAAGGANASPRGWPSSEASPGEPEASVGEPEASASVFFGAAVSRFNTEADASGSPFFGAAVSLYDPEADACGSPVSRAAELLVAASHNCHCHGPSKLVLRGERPSDWAAR